MAAFKIHKLFREAQTARYRSSHQRCSIKISVLKNFAKFTGVKKATLAQVFSCEFCDISKNTFFHRTPPVAVSE